MITAQSSPAPESAHPSLHDLYSRWFEFAKSGRIPTIDEMRYDELVAKYPSTLLVEVEKRAESPTRYCYARVGPEHKIVLGREIQGMSVDELVAPHQVEHFQNIYDRIVREARPHYWMRMNSLVGIEVRTFERLLVPVSRDGKTVDALIGLWVWMDFKSDNT